VSAADLFVAFCRGVVWLVSAILRAYLYLALVAMLKGLLAALLAAAGVALVRLRRWRPARRQAQRPPIYCFPLDAECPVCGAPAGVMCLGKRKV
jgi:hypothetical protein